MSGGSFPFCLPQEKYYRLKTMVGTNGRDKRILTSKPWFGPKFRPKMERCRISSQPITVHPPTEVPYCTTAIVTGGLLCPETLSTTGTSLPGVTPAGTTALTW